MIASSRGSLLTSKFPFIVLGALLVVFLVASLYSNTTTAPSLSTPYQPDYSYGYLSPRQSNSLITTSHQQSLDQINNATLGFSSILAINLPARTDHRDLLTLAAAVSDLSITYLPGVNGSTVDSKVLPPKVGKDMTPSRIGSWRAHIDAVHHMVYSQLPAALIVEDDVDWDMRIRPLMADFALSASTIMSPDLPPAAQLSLAHLSPPSTTPESSPYGDNWDLLWLGHCGIDLNLSSPYSLHNNDPSAVAPHHYRTWDPNGPNPLIDHPPHTRAVFRASGGTCSLAYALSQRGARKLLYELGTQRLDAPFDVMLGQWCNEPSNTCIGVLPQLFDHYRAPGPLGRESDIMDFGDGWRDDGYSANIRWSVKGNLDVLVKGEGTIVDQWPDEKPREGT
jgi:hypothetical protein